jgi:hypothetical protein
MKYSNIFLQKLIDMMKSLDGAITLTPELPSPETADYFSVNGLVYQDAGTTNVVEPDPLEALTSLDKAGYGLDRTKLRIKELHWHPFQQESNGKTGWSSGMGRFHFFINQHDGIIIFRAQENDDRPTVVEFNAVKEAKLYAQLWLQNQFSEFFEVV